jgi:peptide/nickel transport system substrate-binding protein
MRKRSKAFASGVGLVAAASVIAACSSSGSSSSGGTSGSGSSVSLSSGTQGINPGSGSPKTGGTLNMLGVGDVDYMDPNISYFTIGYLGQRPWIRGLYAYPATPGQTTSPAPDLATAPPVISNGGKTYTITIRNGAMWDTSPARQVTAADALRGIERSCNPVQPFGGLPDFESLISGYAQFCSAFANVAHTTSAIQSYMNWHQISGVTASGQTLTFNLVHPASYFPDMLTLDAFNPAPVESLQYLPASAQSQQHPIADGPYTVQSYSPARSITYVRNPVWKASTDPIRKAYVDKIVVTETGNQQTNQQELQTNTAAASMEFDSFPPLASVPGLESQMKQGLNHNFNMGPQYSSNPQIWFNNVSPNNGSALSKVAVRQALSYGLSRAHLTQVINPTVNPPLTHVLPDGINGAQDVPSGYNPYPYNPSKAKSLLSAAGYASGLSVTLLYRPSSSIESAVAQAAQSDLAKIGVKAKLLGVPSADFYTKYLEVPSVAKRGVWDLAASGWGPDWYGDAALSFFGPLYSGPAAYPPVGSNFGFYNNPSVTALIGQAATSASASAAATVWAQADQKVMQDAPFYPITQPLQPLYHASYVHNAVYVPAIQQFDPTNVWLSSPGS